ncbi:MAG: hypothetical protein V4722_01685 [Bacteroidota bacterium]
MKKLFLSIAAILLISAITSAKIWRMNNNTSLTPQITTDFLVARTLQQAHDSSKVVNGDTIHLEQSPTNYGDCTFTKRLTIIGSGYFLSEANPNTQVNTSYNSLTGTLNMQNPACAGTHILGVQSTGIIYMGTSNLTVRNCYVTNIYVGNAASVCDNLSIVQNFIGGPGTTWAILDYNGASVKCNNMRITGNIISHYYGINLGPNFSGIIKNNTINVSITPLSVYNFYVLNNICQNSSASYPSAFINCVVEYNLGNRAQMFTLASKTNTVLGPGIVENPTIGFVTGSTSDGNWQIQNSNPAYLTGKGGISMGAFAGDYPYRLSGLPPVPNVYQLSIAPIAPAAATMSVTVTSKSNN